MKICNTIPSELTRLVRHIARRNGDCENMLRASGQNSNYTWHGHLLFCSPLFCSYGIIGYDIHYRGHSLSIDNELNKITIE